MSVSPASHDLQPDTVLRERFGLAAFRPGQRAVIDSLLTQGSALAVFPTGGGKSLCYQLPALLFEGVTVVVSPLIALMKDQIDALTRLGIPAARMDSSLTADEVREVGRQVREGSLKLLYVAPERFANERFLDLLGRTRIALFAIDEAHCISEWGHNFRPDYLKLADLARTLRVERVLALTATATPPVVDDICRNFDVPVDCAVITGFHRPNLELLTTPTAAGGRDAVLRERLRSRPAGSGIVYVTLQKTAERVATLLAAAGIPARAYHAGLEDVERTAVQEWWGTTPGATVVATIAFGMGIDKADVRYVYHYNLPKGLESYSQEIGRAGRDGEPSIVELLGSLEDVALLENFAYGDTPTAEALESLLGEIAAAGESFDVSLYELSNRHDIRQLVLRTALTYLELRGVLRQGTPFYAGYKARLLQPLPEIVAAFKGERAQFVAAVFASAKQGRSWYSFDPAASAEALAQERDRIVRMLEHLGEQGWIELQVADARQRYARLTAELDVEALAAELLERFAGREAQEIARIGLVAELVSAPTCQTHALLRYFGEERAGACGHCTYCETGQPSRFPPLPAQPALDILIDRDEFEAVCRANASALGLPRQQARFLCGLTSPALAKARLGRHPLFGICERQRFGDVLAWCEALAG